MIAALLFATLTSNVLELEAARFRAMTASDVAVLAPMLSDDLVYIHTSGTVDSKTSLLGRIRSGELRYQSIEPSEQVHVREIGETAVITNSAQMLVSGRRFEIRYTSVYAQRRNGDWQLVSWQSTLLPQPAADIPRLESEWNAAHIRGDFDAIEGMLADDVEMVVPGLPPMDKKSAVTRLRTRRMKFDRYETSDTNTRIYGDTAVVTGRLQRARTIDDKPQVDDWRFTKVYARRDGQWRVVSLHASLNPQ